MNTKDMISLVRSAKNGKDMLYMLDKAVQFYNDEKATADVVVEDTSTTVPVEQAVM